MSGNTTSQETKIEMLQKYKENKAHLEKFLAGRARDKQTQKEEEEPDLLKVESRSNQ